MKTFKIILLITGIGLMAGSCGVTGDPGYCYISVDWEYYNENYGVHHYADDNPDVPDSLDIEKGKYYESYPGTYDYSYKSEDSVYLYSYIGNYTLLQNSGSMGGVFQEGLNGADTYVDIYLYIYARKGLSGSNKLKSVSKEIPDEIAPANLPFPETRSASNPVYTEQRNWSETSGDWTIVVEEEVRVYSKRSG